MKMSEVLNITKIDLYNSLSNYPSEIGDLCQSDKPHIVTRQ